MASFTTGYSFTNSEAVTPGKIHAMVDSAYLVNLVTRDLASGSGLINIATPASPATGDVRVAASGLLEMYYGGAWNAPPGDPLAITLTNKSGSNLVAGDVVVTDPANAGSFTIASVNPAPNVIGVLAESINNNASGLVYVRGCCSVRVAASLGLAAGTLLRGPNGTSGSAAVKVAATGTNDPRSDCFGILLASAGPATTVVATACIWK